MSDQDFLGQQRRVSTLEDPLHLQMQERRVKWGRLEQRVEKKRQRAVTETLVPRGEDGHSTLNPLPPAPPTNKMLREG